MEQEPMKKTHAADPQEHQQQEAKQKKHKKSKKVVKATVGGCEDCGWRHYVKDIPRRAKTIQKIAEILRQEGERNHECLPVDATKPQDLEMKLYMSAPTFEAYNDDTTLRQRLGLPPVTAIIAAESLRLPESQESSPANSLSTTVATPVTDTSLVALATSPLASTSSPPENAPDSAVVVLHQQKRLVRLFHSAKCQQSANCPVAPQCAQTKVLLKHISQCKNSNCQTLHCISSRYILHHYSHCHDPNCAICAPVRGIITKMSNTGGDAKKSDTTQGDSAPKPLAAKDDENEGGFVEKRVVALTV